MTKQVTKKLARKKEQKATLAEVNFTELSLLKDDKLPVSQIFLDPDNPRFTELDANGKVQETADPAIIDPNLQAELLGEIREDGIGELVEKIKQFGFLPMDRVVVRKLAVASGPPRYVVLEGNRRVAALKSFTEKEKAQLSDEIRATLDVIPVLVYTGTNRRVSWLLQGIRHVSGMKNWGPFQQANYLMQLYGSDPAPSIVELSRRTGVKRADASQLIRSYYGLMQAKRDQDWGDQIDEKDFAIFQEAVFHKNNSELAKWLGWSDDTHQFASPDNLKLLLSMLKAKEGVLPRIPRVNPDLRDKFARLLAEPDPKPSLASFLAGSVDLDAAVLLLERTAEQPARAIDLDSQFAALERAEQTILGLPTLPIKKSGRQAEFVPLLSRIETACTDQKQLLE